MYMIFLKYLVKTIHKNHIESLNTPAALQLLYETAPTCGQPPAETQRLTVLIAAAALNQLLYFTIVLAVNACH